MSASSSEPTRPADSGAAPRSASDGAPTPLLPDDVRRAVELLHASRSRVVAICAGAGSRTFAWLHAVSGSSRTVVELVSAYSRASLAAWLGAAPATSAGPGTAAALARAAHARAMALGEGELAIGVAVVAAIASDAAHRAAPRICVATCRGNVVQLRQVALSGGGARGPADEGAGTAVWGAPDAMRRDATRVRTRSMPGTDGDRARHEDLASRLMLNALLEAASLASVACPLAPGEHVDAVAEPLDGLVLAVLGGHLEWLIAPPQGPPVASGAPPRALLAGSFDPLHDGHRQLAQVVGLELGCEVGFELSLANADKGRIDLATALTRVAQFAGAATVVVDRASTFVEKARLFPGTTFVVGYDTAVRVLDPGYYGGVEGRDSALAEIASHGAGFQVAGRVCDGVYRPAESLVVPPAFAAMFRALGEARFRVDVSSTELRQLGRAAARTGRVEEGSA